MESPQTTPNTMETPQTTPNTMDCKFKRKSRPHKRNPDFPDALECDNKCKIGEGSFGKVYQVLDRRTQTMKACKTYDLALVDDQFLTTFTKREIDILLKLSHPNIIGLHRICKAGCFLYLVMDFAENKDMEFYIGQGCPGNIQEKQAKIWIRQIASALEYMHKMGIAHRDIKCENILITQHLNAKLADFGFSRLFLTRDDLSQTFCGTASYAAPEIITNKPYIPFPSDIWALGVVLFRILNKRFPFGNLGFDNNLRKVVKRQMIQSYKFSIKYKISKQAKTLVRKMLNPLPEKRPNPKEIQDDPWIGDLVTEDQSESVEEKEALEKGNIDLGEEIVPVVQELISRDCAHHIVIAENTEKKYADKEGVILENTTMEERICSPAITPLRPPPI